MQSCRQDKVGNQKCEMEADLLHYSMELKRREQDGLSPLLVMVMLVEKEVKRNELLSSSLASSYE